MYCIRRIERRLRHNSGATRRTKHQPNRLSLTALCVLFVAALCVLFVAALCVLFVAALCVLFVAALCVLFVDTSFFFSFVYFHHTSSSWCSHVTSASLTARMLGKVNRRTMFFYLAVPTIRRRSRTAET